MSTTGEVQTNGGGGVGAAAVPIVEPKAPPAVVTTPPAAPSKGRRRVIGALVVVALATAGLIYYLSARRFEETDDAQIDGNITNLSPRVTGTVTAVYVVENQRVKAGDVLLDIDPTDLQVAVAQAKAAVAQAQAQLQAEDPTVSITETSSTAAVAGASSELASTMAGLSGARSDVDQLTARLAQAEGNARLAGIERKRGEELFAAQAMPRAELDRRITVAETAEAEVQATRQALASARQRVAALQAQLGGTKSKLVEVRKNAPREVETRRASVLYRRANLELANAQLAQAQLNLGYAKVRAPLDGLVAKKAVSVGDHVTPGQQLIALVETKTLWVTANYRETQLQRVKVGQPVEIHVDALDRDVSGKVESLGGATGSRLSVLPPENASGNYVKVVQRIPVRIGLDPGQADLDRLRPGMSVEPKIRVVP
jgi:membrane fusion protein (multidrug efflux system)